MADLRRPGPGRRRGRARSPRAVAGRRRRRHGAEPDGDGRRGDARTRSAPTPTDEVDRPLRGAPAATTSRRSCSPRARPARPRACSTRTACSSANQQQMRQVWPFLADEPPVLLDWLPWSHTFGGNHNLNMVLANGGTLWIDDGRPAPGADRPDRCATWPTPAPTIVLQRAGGVCRLLPLLEGDAGLARAFLDRLRLGFFAAAALPQQLWDRLREAVGRARRRDADDDLVGADRDRARRRPRRTTRSPAATCSACRCPASSWRWCRSGEKTRDPGARARTSPPATTAART